MNGVSTSEKMDDTVYDSVHTVFANGDIWSNLPDFCRMLDLSNPRKAASRLPDSVKTTWAEIKGVTYGYALDIPHNAQPHTKYINSAGVRQLVTMSRKPEAKEISAWYFNEAIPAAEEHRVSISYRDWKNGVRHSPGQTKYTPSDIMNVLQDPSFTQCAIQTIANLQKTNQMLTITVSEQQSVIEVQTAQIKEMQPKAEYADNVLTGDGLMTPSRLGSYIGCTGNWVNIFLRLAGVIKPLEGGWTLTAKYLNTGIAKPVPFPVKRPDGSTKIVQNLKYFPCAIELLTELARDLLGIPIGEKVPKRHGGVTIEQQICALMQKEKERQEQMLLPISE